ncbi:leucine-rich repeat flightless-interacting protein 1 isoform X5 [Synchiropus splendidus]|uniref:leucine-rich repeat flightless-interacting protein 1 isoform X5 n=1 Tax=Synchiropus splendidus TaxID=270530 RepID=UPI00237D9D47|nr:leucine-rich repeat flightless-interacting protein 1 isoform X5 [Synchiropus splendidus]
MGTQGAGRKRTTNKERSTAEDDALNLIAREAEARLAAKRAARAEAREIRMKELERQQKEIFQVQKKYYGLNTKVDDRSDGKWGDIEQWMEDSERYSRPSQMHTLSDEDERMSVGSRGSVRASYASSDLYSLNGLSSSRNPGSSFNGYQDNCGSVASYLRSAASSRDLDDVTIPDFPDVDDRDYLEKGSRAASALTAGTLISLGGTSSRRGSGETAITVDAETSIREIKEIHELKDQIQDVETKYTQNLKEVKDALAEVEEKYRKAMVSNAQLDNEKNNLMYHVDTLKDSLMELEELLSESRREYEEKVKEHEREKQAHKVLQFQFNEMKETLKQSEELLNEIRQLRIKQEGFTREISDLQETVEWKDKKIGALERQKEYTDAIRTERDELREEVVKLKDILKKHGIVLGPDLNINGDLTETPNDGGASGESTSEQISQTSPLEGNSMLGNTEDLRSGEEQEEQEQGLFQGRQDNHDKPGDTTSCESTELLVEQLLLSGHGIVTTGDNEGSQIEGLEVIENTADETSPEVPIAESLGDSNKPAPERPVGDFNKAKNFLEEDLKEGEPCPKFEEEPQKSIVVTKTDQGQLPVNNETQHAAAEEVLSKPPSQSSAGKKKKKKRKGKKKGASQEEKKEEESNRTENTEAFEVKKEGLTVEAVCEQQSLDSELNSNPATEPVELVDTLVDNQIQSVQGSQTDLAVDILEPALDSQISQACFEQTGEDITGGNDQEPTQESPELGEQDVTVGDGVEPTEVLSDPTSPEDREVETSTENTEVSDTSDGLTRQEAEVETDVEPSDKCQVDLVESEPNDVEVREPLIASTVDKEEAHETMACPQTVHLDEGPTERSALVFNENISYCDVLKMGLADLDSGGPELLQEESPVGEQSSEMLGEECSSASAALPESKTEPIVELDQQSDSGVGLVDAVEEGSKGCGDIARENIGEDSLIDYLGVSSQPTEALTNGPEVSETPASDGDHCSEVAPMLAYDDSQKQTDVPEEQEKVSAHPDSDVVDSFEKPDEDLAILERDNAADTKTRVSQELPSQAKAQCDAPKMPTSGPDVATPESASFESITSEAQECLAEEAAEAEEENQSSKGRSEAGLEEPLEDAARISRPGNEEGCDEDEEEGQSFDFDELDFESAVDLNDSPEVEDAEEALEVLAEAIDDSPSIRSTTTEEWTEDVGGLLDGDSKALHLSEEATLESKKEDVCAADSPRASIAEETPIKVTATGSCQVDDKTDTPGFSHPAHTGPNKDEPQPKKNNKKGKGKGREECKMS